MKIKCPHCKTDKFLKKISYGMPSDNFDFERLHVGGCIPGKATAHCSNGEGENDEETQEKLEH